MQAPTSTRLHFPISFASLATSHFHEKSSPFSPIRVSPSSPSTPEIHPWRVNVCSTFPFRLPRWKQTAPGLGHLLSLSYFLCLLASLFSALFLSFSFSFLFLRVYPLIRLSAQLGISSSLYSSCPSIHRTIHTGQIVGKHLSNGNKSVMDLVSYIRIVCIICFVLLLYVYILYLCMYVSTCIDDA